MLHKLGHDGSNGLFTTDYGQRWKWMVEGYAEAPGVPQTAARGTVNSKGRYGLIPVWPCCSLDSARGEPAGRGRYPISPHTREVQVQNLLRPPSDVRDREVAVAYHPPDALKEIT